MGIFGSPKTAAPASTNQQVFQGISVNNSEYGTTIPVAIGPNRAPLHLIWAGDWKNTQVTTPATHQGKGLGGGGSQPGTTTNNYTEAIQALLAYGPLDHLDSIWTGNGRIGVTQINTDFTVPGGGGHLDISDDFYSGDYGVGAHTTYSQSVNDFGGPGARTLSGTHLKALTRGTVSAPGVYVVTTPSPGVTRYTFNSVDAGTTVQISYTSLLGTNFNSEETVLAGTTFTVPDTSTFWGPNAATQVIDQGTGNSFARIASGTPTTGQFKVSGTAGTPGGGVFTLATADIGKTLLFKWQSQDTSVDSAHATLNYSISQGTAGQSPWSHVAGTHPDQALGYTGMALWNWPLLYLGSSNAVPQMTAETVHPFYMAGAGIAGANPADVIAAILQDSTWGVRIDPALIGDWTNARNFWQASGFFISLFQDTQSTAMDVISQILDAGQGVMFWDAGKLQLAVYGDTSIAGFGVIYQPDTQPVLEFSIDDFVSQGGKEPVKVESEPLNSVYNRVKIEWVNAQVDYNNEIITEEDTASIAQNGLYEEGQQSFHFIRYANIAQWAANLRLKRYTNIRDTYTFTVPTRYRPLLRLMKLMTLTWDHMGWDQKPLRIIKMEESHSGINLTLEEFPYGVGSATLYPKLTAQAENSNPALVSPGDTALVVIEIPDKMNQYAGREYRVYADFETPDNAGGCNIYFSGDNSEFSLLGEITQSVMMGTLGGSGMTTGTGDPDTQTITVVDTNDVPLLSASAYDFANSFALLAIIDVAGTYEIMAYSTATLVGANTYHVNDFHRALFGTTRASHASGATVIELGEAFLTFTADASQDGQTVYFRAATFNKLQERLQDISTLSSLSVVLNGNNPGLFTNGNINVTVPANKTIYSSTVTVESLKPAEAGAEVTTGKSLTVLADRHLGNLTDDSSSGRYAGSSSGGNTDGFQVLTNPDFASGTHSEYGVYDNNSTGHVVLSTTADAACGNTSGFKLQVAVSAGGESPGLGGFFLGISADSGTFTVNTYHKGSTYLWRVRANIPVGHSIQFASNATGTGGTFTWLTAQAGTGGWFEYVGKQVIGASGSFSSTGFFYIDGSFSSSFNWFVARCSLVNIDAPASISVNYHPRVQYLDPNTGLVPTSTLLNPQLSLLPGQSVPFHLALETTTSVGFSWDTQSLGLPDGSTLSLASGSVSFTGLTAGTTYYFVAYITASGGVATMHFLGPFAGSVTAAQAEPATLDGRAFIGTLHDSTTSSGGGGGGGIDPGACAHEDCMCWVKRGSLEAEPLRMRVGDVRNGDFIKGLDIATGGDTYREVKHFRHQPGTMWFRVQGYLCTALDLVFEDGGWVPAYKAAGAEKVRGLCGKRAEITLDPEFPMEDRNYWLDDGVNGPLLMHNPILPRS